VFPRLTALGCGQGIKYGRSIDTSTLGGMAGDVSSTCPLMNSKWRRCSGIFNERFR